MDTCANWWMDLPDDFSRMAQPGQQHGLNRLKASATAGVDWVASTAFASAIGLVTLSGTAQPKHLRLERPLLDHYKELADLHDAAAVFPRPESQPKIHAKPPSGKGWFQPRDGECSSLWFQSGYQALHPRLRARYRQHRNNLISYAQWWRHHDGPRPTLIALHGYFADPYWFNSRFLALPWFYRQGYDVLLFTLPFHGYRRERGDLFSGMRYLAHGFSHLNETIAHSIHDLRVYMDFLFGQGTPAIGVTGLSLGGYTSALLGTVEERLAFCIPNAPVVSPPDLMLEWPVTRVLSRLVLRQSGIDLPELRHILALHSPLNYRPAVPRERKLIIAGSGDRFASPRHAELLHEHWGCGIHWFPGNHLLHLDQGEYLRRMKAHMDRCVENPPARV